MRNSVVHTLVSDINGEKIVFTLKRSVIVIAIVRRPCFADFTNQHSHYRLNKNQRLRIFSWIIDFKTGIINTIYAKNFFPNAHNNSHSVGRYLHAPVAWARELIAPV
jgi:hypothetical protein